MSPKSLFIAPGCLKGGRIRITAHPSLPAIVLHILHGEITYTFAYLACLTVQDFQDIIGPDYIDLDDLVLKLSPEYYEETEIIPFNLEDFQQSEP